MSIQKNTNRQANRGDRFIFDPVDPNKKAQPDEVVNGEDLAIVNTAEQSDVLNKQDGGSPENNEIAEKEKGYAEGTRDDSLTEPEYRDSDDQPGFPEEEGN